MKKIEDDMELLAQARELKTFEQAVKDMNFSLPQESREKSEAKTTIERFAFLRKLSNRLVDQCLVKLSKKGWPEDDALLEELPNGVRGRLLLHQKRWEAFEQEFLSTSDAHKRAAIYNAHARFVKKFPSAREALAEKLARKYPGSEDLLESAKTQEAFEQTMEKMNTHLANPIASKKISHTLGRFEVLLFVRNKVRSISKSN